ncbi:MAG: hypothetical protein H5T49_00575 [Hadesarchaea archaeon]|nr:hypothetical protein [Hadesarchaea archaeon]
MKKKSASKSRPKKPRRPRSKKSQRTKKPRAPRGKKAGMPAETIITYPEKPYSTEISLFGKNILTQLEAGAEAKKEETSPSEASPRTAPEQGDVGAKAEFVKKITMSAKPPAESLWLEVRPFVGQEMRVANFLDLVNMMVGSGQTFEFLMAAGPDPSELGGQVPFPRRVVRYFLKCPDSTTKELAKNVLQAAKFAVEEIDLSFENGKLVWCEPDVSIEYPFEAELELATHYGSKPLFPEQPTYERSFEQFVDVPKNIHAAILSGGALRIVVRRNDRAPIHLKMPGARDGSSVGGALSYHFGGFMRNMARMGKPDGVEEERQPLQTIDVRAQQEVMKRASLPWFSCDFRAYGTQEQIRAIVSSLTFPSNRFKVFRIRKCVRSQTAEKTGRLGRLARLFSGSRGRLKHLADFFSGSRVDPSLQELKGLVRLMVIISFPLFLVFLWGIGAWNPLGALDSPFDQALLILAFIIPLVLRSAWRMRKTIALTISELPLIVSLPNKPEVGHFYFSEARVPVEIKEDVKPQKGPSETEMGELT